MGKTKRPYPRKLARKLAMIRNQLGLSQNEMLRKLGIERDYDRSTISGYERGEREPPLPILLKYARLAGVSTDVLIDDKLKLPK
jgi:transcriptional regulator with XRE-family HTH domain